MNMKSTSAPLRVNVFTSSFQRFGSETSLFNLIRQADPKDLDIVTICRYGGDLLEELPKNLRRHRCDRDRSLFQRIIHKIEDSLPWNRKNPLYVPAWLRLLHRRYPADVWSINTLAQVDMVRYAKRLGVPMVLHVQELAMGLQWTKGDQDVKDLMELPDLVIGCSEAVRQMVNILGRKESVEVLYPTNIAKELQERDRSLTLSLREKWNIPAGRYLWVSTGFICPRKNPLLFIDLMRELQRRGHDVQGVWIGTHSSAYGHYAKCYANDVGMGDRITWVGERSHDYIDYMDLADGYVLTSTQESFSIATLQAVCLGKPSMITSCGGATEIVTEGMGLVSSGWNLQEMADGMEKIMKKEWVPDPSKIHEGIQKFEIDFQTDRWTQMMRKYFQKRGIQ